MKCPKKGLRLIGHDHIADTYVSKTGEYWLYMGFKKSHYTNCNYWKKPSTILVRDKKDKIHRMHNMSHKEAIYGK